MAEAGVLVNDSFRPGFDVAETLSKGNTIIVDSSGEAAKGADDASKIAGFALTDGDPTGDNLDQVVTVIPAVKGYVLNVIVNKADGTGVSNVAVGDELFYRSDGTLAKEADGSGGSSRTVSSEVAAIALEAQTADDDALKKVLVIGGV